MIAPVGSACLSAGRATTTWASAATTSATTCIEVVYPRSNLHFNPINKTHLARFLTAAAAAPNSVQLLYKPVFDISKIRMF